VDAFGDALAPHLFGNIQIICSTAGRAKQTAQRLQARLQTTAPIPALPCLWADDAHAADDDAAAEIVACAEHGQDALIVVTHAGYVRSLVRRFAERHGFPNPARGISVEPAQGIVLFLDAKKAILMG
jgi:phosphohistidine phosphatase SixA